MSRVAPATREPVELDLRGSMSAGRKLRIHTSRGGKCWMCGKPVPTYGPEVRYDHKLCLELGGSDDDSNIWPLHREPCDRLKTAADARRIAKMRRQSKMDEPREPTSIQSPGFDKRFIRSVNGKTRARPPVGGQGFSGSSSIETAAAPKEVRPADAEPSRSGGSK